MFKKKEKKTDLKLKKPAEVSVEVGYTQKQEVQTAKDVTFYSTTDVSPNTNSGKWSISYTNGDEKREYEIDKLHIMNECAFDYKYLELFSLPNMRQRIDDGETVADIVSDMENFITENWETNPDAVQRAIAQLLRDEEKLYDKCVYAHDLNMFFNKEGYHRINLGNNTEEVLSSFMNLEDEEEKHGAVCSTIAASVLPLFKKVGAEAVLISGGSSEGNHTTLLWKRSDGKYVQSNYGKSYTLEGVTNIIDAAYAIFRNDLGLRNNGYIYFEDEHGMYVRSSMAEVAV